MNLLSLEVIQKNHRRELEQRLENAKSNLKNLDRMAEEAFREIDRRATEDKETLSKIFHTLTANEEVNIFSLKEELGLGYHENMTATEVLERTGRQMNELEVLSELPEPGVTMQLPEIKFSKRGGKKDAAI